MAKRLNDQVKTLQGYTNSAGAVGPWVGDVITGTGYSRARFIFSFSTGGLTGSLSAGLAVWEAAASGGTYALMTGASLGAKTSGVLSGGANNICIIDVPIKESSRWLKVSGGSILSTAVAHSCVVELYDGITRPPTHTHLEMVTI